MILVLLSNVHVLSAVQATPNIVEIIAWIGIPLFLAFCGMTWGGIKGAIRFAKYMTHSEESIDSIAESNANISGQLSLFVDKTNVRLNLHDQEIAVLNYAIGPNGNSAKEARLHREQESDVHRWQRESKEGK